jgi:hypothetical protein
MAILEPGVNNSSYLFLGIGLFSIIGGGAACLWQN